MIELSVACGAPNKGERGNWKLGSLKLWFCSGWSSDWCRCICELMGGAVALVEQTPEWQIESGKLRSRELVLRERQIEWWCQWNGTGSSDRSIRASFCFSFLLSFFVEFRLFA